MNAAKRSYRTPTPEVWEDRWCDAALLKNEKLGIRFFIQDVVMVSLSVIYVALEAHWRRIEAQIGAHEAQIGAAGVLLIWLTWVDRRTERLPNVLVGALAALAGVTWLTGALPVGGVNALLGVLVGGGALWGLAALMERLTGRTGLGMGDVKLLAALGAWTGVSGLPLVLLLASWAALPWALWVMVTGQRDRRLPFGPFLCLAGWVVMLFQPWMWRTVAALAGHGD